MLVVFVCSLSTFEGGTAPLRFFWMSFQVSSSIVRSSCSSAVFLPSAAVLTITPKFFGLIDSTIFCRRFLSSAEWIFRETATMSLNGVITTKRPGSEISQLSRGPFAAIGSFNICTNMLGLPLKTSLIFPVLIISGSTSKPEKSYPVALLSVMAICVNFRRERAYGLRSV